MSVQDERPHRQEGWLREKYYGENLTFQEIADMAGIHLTTLRYQTEKYEIRHPTPEDDTSGLSECPGCGKFYQRDNGMRKHYGMASDSDHEGNIWSYGRDVVCDNCGNEFTRYDSKDGYWERNFCNQDCYHEYTRGENHPNWRGGQRYDYGKGWNETRKSIIRASQDFKCGDCGNHENIVGKSLQVHHIVPAREFDNPEERNHPSNLIALCHSCHMKREWELNTFN